MRQALGGLDFVRRVESLVADQRDWARLWAPLRRLGVRPQHRVVPPDDFARWAFHPSGIGGRLGQPHRLLDTGISEGEIKAIAHVAARRGVVVGIEVRPSHADLANRFLPGKPMSFVSSRPPRDAADPLRYGVDGLYVSDIDPAGGFDVRTGRAIPNFRWYELNAEINRQLGYLAMRHPDTFNGHYGGYSTKPLTYKIDDPRADVLVVDGRGLRGRMSLRAFMDLMLRFQDQVR